jgi:glycosyltransferase involved in cell wall biosynthesis
MQPSIVVSTYNRRDLVLRTVHALLQQDFPSSKYEIIVVVDGSRDGTAEALRAFGERVRVVEQENRGLAGARNRGAHSARGELLVFLDDDMQCVPRWVAEHVAAHAAAAREHSEIAGLGAIYAHPESPRKLAAAHFSRTLGAPYLRHRDDPGVPWPEGVWSFGNTSIRRAVLERAGGFDERFRMREDGELGVRLRALGVQQRFIAGATAYQWCDKSAAQLVRDARAFAESDLLFLRTHPGQDPHGYLKRIRAERGWKRQLRRLLLARPEMADVVLAGLCALGETFPVRPLRETAVRALLLRCGLQWLRRLSELSGICVDEWLRN